MKQRLDKSLGQRGNGKVMGLNANKRGPTRRSDRMALRIRECFSKALLREDIYWGPCQGLTITHVDLSPDLRNAKVFVMSAEKIQKNELLSSLEKNKYYFKNIIATELRMRFIPEIVFKLDDSFERLQRINEILRNDNIQT